MVSDAHHHCICSAPAGRGGIRLDVFLSSRFPELSRSRIQTLIKGGKVDINGSPVTKPSQAIRPGDNVSITIPPPKPLGLEPEAIDFDILYEDESLVVVDKPAGLVVHPAPGHDTGTLVHGLLQRCDDLSGIGGMARPGIVHRLDKDTSGAMIVAKTDAAHHLLSWQFKNGLIGKEYLALVHGIVHLPSGAIEAPIARHRMKRREMCVPTSGGRYALSLWERREVYRVGCSLLSVRIKTGRTHQIRVHLAYIGHPVVGDAVYGRGSAGWRRTWSHAKADPPVVERQMLHAFRITFDHPVTRKRLLIEAPLPEDMATVLEALRAAHAEI